MKKCLNRTFLDPITYLEIFTQPNQSDQFNGLTMFMPGIGSTMLHMDSGTFDKKLINGTI